MERVNSHEREIEEGRSERQGKILNSAWELTKKNRANRRCVPGPLWCTSLPSVPTAPLMPAIWKPVSGTMLLILCVMALYVRQYITPYGTSGMKELFPLELECESVSASLYSGPYGCRFVDRMDISSSDAKF